MEWRWVKGTNHKWTPTCMEYTSQLHFSLPLCLCYIHGVGIWVCVSCTTQWNIDASSLLPPPTSVSQQGASKENRCSCECPLSLASHKPSIYILTRPSLWNALWQCWYLIAPFCLMLQCVYTYGPIVIHKMWWKVESTYMHAWDGWRQCKESHLLA